MTKRLNYNLSADSELWEKMWEHDPPIMNPVALRTGYVRQFIEIGSRYGLDGQEIGRLFGVQNREDPELERGYEIKSYKHKRDLELQLTKLMSAIRTDLGYEEKMPEKCIEAPEEILNESEYELYMVYSRARKIRNQLQFALEHDLDLEIG